MEIRLLPSHFEVDVVVVLLLIGAHRKSMDVASGKETLLQDLFVADASGALAIITCKGMQPHTHVIYIYIYIYIYIFVRINLLIRTDT